MRRITGDPYWTTARFDGKDVDGQPVKRGTRIFYYPHGKRVLQGEKAEAASRDFESHKFDEMVYNS